MFKWLVDMFTFCANIGKRRVVRSLHIPHPRNNTEYIETCLDDTRVKSCIQVIKVCFYLYSVMRAISSPLDRFKRLHTSLPGRLVHPGTNWTSLGSIQQASDIGALFLFFLTVFHAYIPYLVLIQVLIYTLYLSRLR